MKPPTQTTRQKVTVAEAEEQHTPKNQKPERVKKFPQLSKPFGFNNDLWEKLKAQMLPGDELWECCTDQESWDKMRGREWIELTRGGKSVCIIITSMN